MWFCLFVFVCVGCVSGKWMDVVSSGDENDMSCRESYNVTAAYSVSILNPIPTFLLHVPFSLFVTFGCEMYRSMDGCVVLPWPNIFRMIVSGPNLKNSIEMNVSGVRGNGGVVEVPDVVLILAGHSSIFVTLDFYTYHGIHENSYHIKTDSQPPHIPTLQLQDNEITLIIPLQTKSIATDAIIGWLCLLPPFFAVFIAILSRQILLALFSAIFLASFFLYRFSLIVAYQRTIDEFYINALANLDHALIVLFCFFMAAMVATVVKLGGLVAITTFFTKKCQNSQNLGSNFQFLFEFCF
jgi:hypothetical protein